VQDASKTEEAEVLELESDSALKPEKASLTGLERPEENEEGVEEPEGIRG